MLSPEEDVYNDFFEVFGRKRRDVAIYEKHVEKLNNKNGWIDLFWPKTLLIEQKSEGRNLKKAEGQAIDYYINIKDSEKPRYLLLSDFQNFLHHLFAVSSTRYGIIIESEEAVQQILDELWFPMWKNKLEN